MGSASFSYHRKDLVTLTRESLSLTQNALRNRTAADRQFYFIGRGEILKISEKIILAANIKLLTFSIKEIIIQIQQLNKYLII